MDVYRVRKRKKEIGHTVETEDAAIKMKKQNIHSQNKFKANTVFSTSMLTTDVQNDNSETDVEHVKHVSFWLTRVILLRYLGFIYFVAFFIAFQQNNQLIGPDGLLPANHFLDSIKRHNDNKSTWHLLKNLPSILWFIDYNKSLTLALDLIALAGMGLSVFVALLGASNWFIMLTLWILYQSLVNVGQRWYGFGWESQLLESGFLATFLCPVWSLQRFPKDTPTSCIVVFAFRWLIFRIMMGAGLIKIRGDKCWRDLTCMNYHYETQPVPNPVSYYLHQSPDVFHTLETLCNHFVELLAPFLLLVPSPHGFCMAGGIILICFQVMLIVSGNLSFLNWLTILPCLACFDDASIMWMFPKHVCHRVSHIRQQTSSFHVKPHFFDYLRKAFNASLAVLIAYLSFPVMSNLLSHRQAMNTSFDSLRLVNTYGAFGSVTKTRDEVIIQGTSTSNLYDASAVWEDYEFNCKPGNISRRPCLISPYHYRLDWLMWFAAFQTYQHNPWFVHLAIKLLVNDKMTTSLLEYNPFYDRNPPRYIRAELYRYKFTRIGGREAQHGHWWMRKHLRNYLPPMSLKSAKPVARQMGWKIS